MKRLFEIFLLLLVTVLWGCGTQKDVSCSRVLDAPLLLEDPICEGEDDLEVLGIDSVPEPVPNGVDGVFHLSEQQPEFPGGMRALMEYIDENLKYPEISRENNSQGRALVGFIVNVDGSICDAEIIKSSCDVYLDEEALRLVNSMPKWKPAMQEEKPVVSILSCQSYSVCSDLDNK